MPQVIDVKPIQVEQKMDGRSSKYSEAELKKLKKVCADFESIFTYQLMKTMRQTIPKSTMGIGNYGRDIFTTIIDQKIAESISAQNQGVGLKKVLFDQLTNGYKSTIPKEVSDKLK
jgi:flagellar protein FlgJ